MANHMKEVAKMFGVELREEFKLVFGNGNTSVDSYYFVESGIYNASKGYFETSDILANLLAGITTIKRKPWKPKDEETYWYVDENGTAWNNDWDDEYLSDHINYYKLGNCYRTKEEAEANCNKWVKFYKSDEVLEV